MRLISAIQGNLQKTVSELPVVDRMACVGAGMNNTKVLDQLGPSGFVINIACGSVVKENENDLITALKSQAIAGAAMDVFENQPSPDSRFCGLSNYILQPHIWVLTKENRVDLAKVLKQNLRS